MKGEEVKTSLFKRESDGDMYMVAARMARLDQMVWYVDTDASSHITPYKEWFCKYEMYNRGNVVLGDDTTVNIIGRNKIRLKLHDYTVRTFLKVMHILGMNINLFLVGTMADA